MTKKFLFNKILYVILALFFLSCGRSGTSGKDENPIFDISEDSNIVNFKANDAGVSYKSIPLKNLSSNSILIYQVLFSKNVCGDFSLFNIVDSQGQTLIEGTTSEFSLNLNSQEYIYINIRYMPSNCVYTDYTTTLYVKYFEDGESKYATVNLKPDTSGSEGQIICDQTPLDFTYTELPTLSGKPEAGTYYLRIDRMVAFIVPSLTGESDILGTDVDIDPTLYQPTYLEVVVDSSGHLTVTQIEECTLFILPSDPEQRFMKGANTVIKTKSDVPGDIDSEGNIIVDEINVVLRTEDIGEGSLIPDESGTFQAALRANLITGITDENENLFYIFNVADKKGLNAESIMNLNDDDSNTIYSLEGSPIENGKVTLVGIGTFNNEDNDFIGQNTAKAALIDNTAYIFLQIEATFTTRDGEAQ